MGCSGEGGCCAAWWNFGLGLVCLFFLLLSSDADCALFDSLVAFKLIIGYVDPLNRIELS